MRYHEIISETNRPARSGLSRADFLTAIYRYNREQRQNGEDNSKQALLAAYRDLMTQIRFPLTVYRGLSWNDEPNFDARIEMDLTGSPDTALLDNLRQIDWSAIGTSWTWDKQAAVYGGALDTVQTCECLLTAVVTAQQVDIETTILQNLTVYQEEKEVRLHQHMPISIISVNPRFEGLILPIKANTGRERMPHDTDLTSIINYMKRR